MMADYLTQDGIDNLHQLEDVFKQEAARAIEEWRVARGATNKTDFAAQFGVPRATYNRISLAKAVVSTEDYAKIYLVTGLRELDPRQVPDRLNSVNGKYFAYKRAWTDEEWNAWKAKHNKVQHSLAGAPASSPASGAPAATRKREAEASVTRPTPYRSTLSDVVEAFLEETVTRIAEKIAAGSPSPRMTEGELIEEFLAFVNKYSSGSPEMRDRLFKEYGRVLIEIEVILDALTNSDVAARELAIRINRR